MKKLSSIALLLISTLACLKADDGTNAATPTPPLTTGATTTTTTSTTTINLGGNQAANAAQNPPAPATGAGAKLTPEQRYAVLRQHLLTIGRRMMEVQQETPDAIIKAISDQYHLDNSAGLAALPPQQGTQTLEGIILALYQAAPSDPVAAGLLAEFHISVKAQPALAPEAAEAPHAVTASPSATQAEVIKKRLAAMAQRMVQVQQQTPDPSIKAIVDAYHLDDAAGLAALPPEDSMDRLKKTAIALFQASKTDPLAVQLLKEFQITYTPRTATPAPAPPAPATAN